MTEKLQFENHDILICRRRGRRSLSIKIVPFQPIQVLTNVGTEEKDILRFLMEKKHWIEKTLSKIETSFSPSIDLVLKKGMKFPLRGTWKSIHPVITFNRKIFFSETDQEILLHIPRNDWSGAVMETEFTDLKKTFVKFYKTLALRELNERAEFWQSKMNLKAQKISFRLTTSRWGSCNSKGKISLNWKLVCMPLELQDYVIVHELSHLVHMNHSPRFWALVETEMPERKLLQRKLHELQFIADFLKVREV